MIITAFLVTSQSTVTLQVTVPPEGPSCPGEDVVLTCSVNTIQKSTTVPPTMYCMAASEY